MFFLGLHERENPPPLSLCLPKKAQIQRGGGRDYSPHYSTWSNTQTVDEFILVFPSMPSITLDVCHSADSIAITGAGSQGAEGGKESGTLGRGVIAGTSKPVELGYLHWDVVDRLEVTVGTVLLPLSTDFRHIDQGIMTVAVSFRDTSTM